MNKVLSAAVLIAMMAATPVLAQQTGVSSAPATGIPADSTSPHASPKDSSPTQTPASEDTKAGYTKKQARHALKKNGYTKVQKLIQDKNGLWHATATKDGTTSQVSLDPQGNITVP